MNQLLKKLKNSESGLTIYSLTPPKETISDDELKVLNKRRAMRISSIHCDAISIYDVQEEKTRNSNKRTFEYKTALDPQRYGNSINIENNLPQIIYLATGKYTREELLSIYKNNREKAFVLVGSPCSETPVKTTLKQAYEISSIFENPTGGVLIGERHQNGSSEVERVLGKIDRGADFFISQCIYDGLLYEKFLKNYAEESQILNYTMKPIILTFSPIGNTSSIDFMKWLGVQIPEEFLRNIPDKDNFIDYSVTYHEEKARKLIDLAIALKIPFGINFESVIGKRTEVLASLKLFSLVSDYMNQKLNQVDDSLSSLTRNLKSGVSALSS
jgi:methylenetetrahydrofolate reductase (NADPH)